MQDLELQIGKVIIQSREIETLLREIYDAEGKGLHQLISSVEESLIRDNISIKEIRKIASIRNDVTHNSQGNKYDLDKYQNSANLIINNLQELKQRKIEEKERLKKQKLIEQEKNKQEQERVKKEEIEEKKRFKRNKLIAIGVIFIVIVYLLIPSGKSEKEIISELNNLNTEIKISMEHIRSLKDKLKIEKDKQGTLRNLFNDNEIVNELQNKLDIEENKLSKMSEKEIVYN